MSRTVLIDADIPIFMCSATNENPIYWGDGLWTLHSYEESTLNDFDYFIETIASELRADRVVLTVSDDANFRKDILPSYKHNRTNKRQPMLRYLLKDHAENEYDCYKRPGLEGDDVLGILAGSHKIIKGERVIVSIDKDMKTIPGKILNWNHAWFAKNKGLIKSVEDAIFEVTDEQADYFHLLQTLAGDTVDGYGGCPGIGMQTADAILQEPAHVVYPVTSVVKSGKNKGTEKLTWKKIKGDFTLWETIVSYFNKAGLSAEDALVQARVARICRYQDYNFKKGEVIPWTP